MSEIKFACPHCSQHIACDGGYDGLGIECPSCGGTMVVPRLSAADSTHSAMVIVASTSASKPRESQQIPPPRFLGEWKWMDQSHANTRDSLTEAPLWMASLVLTFVVAFVVGVKGMKMAPVIWSLVLGGILTGFLMAKGQGKSSARSLLTGLAFAFALVILAPAVLLGILFVGCAACSQ